MKPKRCGATHKRRYTSEGAAIEVAIRLTDDSQSQRHPPSVYRCPACRDWHVGHLPSAVPSSRKQADLEKTAPLPPPSLRCDCHCRKAATETVTTPHGTFACCAKHARALQTRHYLPAEHG